MKTCYLGRIVRQAECPRALPGRAIGVKSVALSSLGFSFFLCLFVSLSTSASLSLASLGLLPTSDSCQPRTGNNCGRGTVFATYTEFVRFDVFGFLLRSIFVVLVVLSCCAKRRRCFPTTGLRLR